MVIILISLLLGLSGAWFMSRYAYRFGLLDLPNDRSSHSLPTPRGGGIGILATFVVSSLALNVPIIIWLSAALLALVSFLDDKLNLSPRTRFGVQFAAALTVAGYAHLFPFVQYITSLLPFSFLSVMLVPLILAVFIVGTANFYNFMDGINGIAGITGVVGFSLLGAYAKLMGMPPPFAASAFCIGAACIGFLPFNIPKARVFMGDVGSVLLGFIFATYIIVLARDMSDFLIMAGFLSTFYADALTTLYVRKRDGERLSQAHRRHLYQLFANQKQVSHWKVSAGYGVLQALIGLSLFALHPFGCWVIAGWEALLLLGWWTVMGKIRCAVEVS